MRNARTEILRTLSIVTSLVLLGAAEPNNKKTIPADFRIIAEYGAGYSHWESWKATVTSDGKVAQDSGFEDAKKTLRLSKGDLEDLLARIEEVDFFALKGQYSYNVTDNPTLILTITRNKKTRKVAVYAPNHLKNNEEVKRFLRIWAEFLRKIPSPNPDQRPELYEPRNGRGKRPS